MAEATDEEVELVRSFANTVDVEAGTDRLRDGDGFAAWLRERGLPGGDGAVGHGAVGDDDLALARRLRAALRAELVGHHDGVASPEARTALDAVAAELPLVVRFPDAGPPVLAPAGDGPRAALAAVLAAVAAAAGQGWWERLKLCSADDCAWAFFDQSRNRSRRWCSMDVCGNRTKTRTYRSRRRA